MNNRLLKRILIALLIIFLAVFVDQISKYLISKNMELYSFKSIIPGVLNFRYITNYGFLLGIGSNLNDGKTFNGVVIITIIALIILLGYFIFIILHDSTSNYLLITFSILIGGAWGNFIDRLIKGKVVDFLEFVLPLPINRIGRYYVGSTPIFNMADFFVTIGIIMLLIYYFIIEPYENKKKKELETEDFQEDLQEHSQENSQEHSQEHFQEDVMKSENQDYQQVNQDEDQDEDR